MVVSLTVYILVKKIMGRAAPARLSIWRKKRGQSKLSSGERKLTPSFRFWVKKTKKFELATYLNLK